MNFEWSKIEWCERHPTYTFILGYIVFIVVGNVISSIFGGSALILYIIYFALSAYVLYLKERSMWWLLLAGLFSPVWLQSMNKYSNYSIQLQQKQEETRIRNLENETKELKKQLYLAKQNNSTNTTPSTTPADLSVLESAFLARYDEELEKKVNISLDKIAMKGEPGINILVDRLYKDMTIFGDRLNVKNYGDYSWNEWLKRRSIVEALGRARAKSTIPKLVPLIYAKCPEGQFYEIFQPAVVSALAEIGGVEVIDHLKKLQEASDTSENTRLAANKALDGLIFNQVASSVNNVSDVSTTNDINTILSTLKFASLDDQEDVVKLKFSIKKTWGVDSQIYSISKQEVEEIKKHFPVDEHFLSVTEQHQILQSKNSIVVHPYGAWIDLGYVIFSYNNSIYYVNVDPTVRLTESIYYRMDNLSNFAKIMIVLNSNIMNQRNNLLIKLEGKFTNTDEQKNQPSQQPAEATSSTHPSMTQPAGTTQAKVNNPNNKQVPLLDENPSDEKMLLILNQFVDARANDDDATYNELLPVVREIGYVLDRRGGMDEMQRFFYMTRNARGRRGLEISWEGIGFWLG